MNISLNDMKCQNGSLEHFVFTLILNFPGGHIQPDTHPWLTHSRSRFWQVLAHSIPASLALSHSNRCSGGGQEIERRPTGETHTQRIHYMYPIYLNYNILSTCVQLWSIKNAQLWKHGEIPLEEEWSSKKRSVRVDPVASLEVHCMDPLSHTLHKEITLKKT